MTVSLWLNEYCNGIPCFKLSRPQFGTVIARLSTTLDYVPSLPLQHSISINIQHSIYICDILFQE